MVGCHKIAQELHTRLDTDIVGEFSYKQNKVLELIILLVMMFYSNELHYKLIRNNIKRENICGGRP